MAGPLSLQAIKEAIEGEFSAAFRCRTNVNAIGET